MTEDRGYTYGTKSELSFIQNMGSGLYSKNITIPRLKLLKNYRNALQARKRWDDINPAPVFVTLEQQIEREELV